MKYAKAIAAVVTTVLVGVVAAMAGGEHITPLQWTNVAIAGIGACGVFAAPNVPGAMFTKSIIAALTAVLMFLATVIVPCTAFVGCHISTANILQMVVISLGALSVYAVPNNTNEAMSANALRS